MKKLIVLAVSLLAAQSQAAPSDASHEWLTLINKLEAIHAGMDRASRSLAAPLPSVEWKTERAPCKERGLDGRCDTVGIYASPVAAYKAEDVKKYHRDAADAVAKTYAGIGEAFELISAASERPDFGEQEKAALRALRDPAAIAPAYIRVRELAARHVSYLKSVAGMSGSVDMGDMKAYRDVINQTWNAMADDCGSVDVLIARVKVIGGISRPDGRYFTDLKELDDSYVLSVLVFRDLKGHEKEVEEMAVVAGLVTRKTSFGAHNVRKVIYLKDEEILPAELKKQWFQDDEQIVAVSLATGQGTSRRAVNRYTLRHFQRISEGRKTVNALRMEIAFLRAIESPETPGESKKYD